MKKFTKFLVAVLTVALLLGTVFAIGVSADDTTPDASASVPASQDDAPWVISKNVSYSENIHLLLAINASKVEDESLLGVKVTMGERVCEEFNGVEYVADLYGESDEGAVEAYVIHTLGVAAKDMADELTIEIVYDGNIVETTTYSVAEYFYERLYKDEIILATDGAKLNQKELYLASLKYGNAAQKLLASSDVLYIEDAIYIRSDVESVPTIFDSNQLLTLPAGYYNVKSYVNGEIVNSVVSGGNYMIKNPAVISMINTDSSYKAPEDAIDFDVEADNDYGFSGAASKDLGLAGGAISKVYYRQNSSATTLSVITKNDADGDYLAINKSVAGGQQTWMNIVIDTSKTSDFTTLVFEAKMRLNITTYGSGYRLRMYSGSRTDNSGGTEFADAGMVLKSGYEFGSYGKDDSSKAKLGISSNEWFTIRIAVSDYVDANTSNYVVSILNEDTEQFEVKYKKSISTLTDVSTISCMCWMDSSDTVYTNDIQYMYVGEEPATIAVPELSGTSDAIVGQDESAYGQVSYANLTTDVNGNGAKDNGDVVGSPSSIKLYDEFGAPIPQWKGSVVIYKDILTNDVYGYMDDTHGGSNYSSGSASESDARNLDVGQGQLNFYTTASFTTKVVVEADLMLDNSSLGTYNSGNLFRLQVNSKNVMGLRFDNSGGKIVWTADGNSKTTTAAFGEWFHVRYEYVYTPAADGAAASATATVIVTDIRGEVTSHTYTCGSDATINPSAYAVRASVVPSKSYQSLFYTRNVVITNE